MKFKHTPKNYLLAPFIVLVNPCIYLLALLVEKLHNILNYTLDILPKFDIDYSKEISVTHKKVTDEYFKFTQKDIT